MQLMDGKSVRKTPGAQGVNPSTEHTSLATNTRKSPKLVVSIVMGYPKIKVGVC